MPNQPRVLKKEVLEKETLKDFDPRLKVFNENKVKELINKKFGSSDSTPKSNTPIVKDPDKILNRRGGMMKKGGTVKSKKKK